MGVRRAELGANSDDDLIRGKAADRKAEYLLSLTNFYEEFATLVRPYVATHQKAPPF